MQASEQITLPTLDLTSGAVGALIHQDASGAYTTTISGSGTGASINAALSQVSTAFAQVGSVQSRLDFSASIAATARTNHEAALSVIRDADMASDTTAISRLKMLTDAHTSMLAQAKDSGAKLISLLSRN